MTNELRPEVAAHLAEDAASPEELRELRATAALLGALPQIAPRRTFILTPEQVAAAGTQRAARRLRWVWPTRWATALAAVCFAITVGLGQGAAPEPAAVAPDPTVAAATATPQSAAGVGPLQGTVEPTVQAFVFGTVVVVSTPTAVPAQPPQAAPPASARADWRPVQVALGALTALGAFFGFVLPPFLRRRDVATA